MAAPRRHLRDRIAGLARPRAREALPVRLDRSRIYILPTRFGLFYGALVATMALGALNYNNNPALLLALLLAGVALTSLLLAHLQLSGLEVLAVGGGPVPAGHALPLRVHARAEPGRLRRGLRIAVPGASATLSIDPDDGSGEAVLAIPTQRRGWLPLPRLEISTVRPLGLARAWAWCWPAAPVLVYPAPEADPPPLPPGTGHSARARLRPAGDDVHHLRAYRRGDPRRTIAWKPSARRDTLLVREYEQPLGEVLDLDWQGLHGLAHEARIRRLARWVDDAEREARRYRLLLPGQAPIGPAGGAGHRHACLRALALLPGEAGTERAGR